MSARNILEIPGYRKVYNALARYGEHGGTVWEVHQITGVPVATVINRLNELCRAGKVVKGIPTGDRDRMGSGGREFVDTFVSREQLRASA